jgi:hypothetical protein
MAPPCPPVEVRVFAEFPLLLNVADAGPEDALTVFVFCEFPEFVSLLANVFLTVELPDPETFPPVALPPCEVEVDLLLPPAPKADAVAFEEELDEEFELLVDALFED